MGHQQLWAIDHARNGLGRSGDGAGEFAGVAGGVKLIDMFDLGREDLTDIKVLA